MSPTIPCRKKLSSPCSLLLALLGTLSLGAAVPERTAEGYKVPQEGYTFTFPRDHGSHPEFGLEWWYLVTHLVDTEGQRYGLQATFFRTALKSPAEHDDPSGAVLGDDQIFLAHMALAEIETGNYRYEERLNRPGWNASASTETMDCVNGNWRLRMVDPTAGQEEIHLQATVRGDIEIDMLYRNTKPLVRFGDNGVSLKGEAPDARSYYLTFTRLAAEGTLLIDGEEFTVSGSGWLDHEISSGQLAEEQIGWNWSGLQLDDGREVMAFILRREDGSVDPYSVFNVVDQNGQATEYRGPGFTWTNTRFWTSPRTGGEYPIEAIVRGPDPAGGELYLHLVPLLDEAELGGELGGIDYWEGPMEVRNEAGERIGRAYLELTGFSESIGDRL